MTPTEKLLAWHLKWTLSEGVVTCRSCRTAQPEHQRAQDFSHASWCDRSVLASSPWLELDGVRDAFPPVAAPTIQDEHSRTDSFEPPYSRN